MNINNIRKTGTKFTLIMFPLIIVIGFGVAAVMVLFGQAPAFENEIRSPEFYLMLWTDPTMAVATEVHHSAVFIGLLLGIPTSLILKNIVDKKYPVLGLAGSAFMVIGAFFGSALLGYWLVLPNISNASVEQNILLKVLNPMIQTQGLLLLFTVLTAAFFIGLILLEIGLLISKAIPKWSAALSIVSIIVALVFMETDALAFWGWLGVLIGFIPLIRGSNPKILNSLD